MYELGTLSSTRPLQRCVRWQPELDGLDLGSELFRDINPLSFWRKHEANPVLTGSSIDDLSKPLRERKLCHPGRSKNPQVFQPSNACGRAIDVLEVLGIRYRRFNVQKPRGGDLDLSDWNLAHAVHCHLTVELSGAHADVWAWHLMVNASARAIC
jgi:hypothetical protein